MSDPCSEKENIKQLFEFHNEKMSKLHEMELRQVSMASDVTHVKTRIDNGMSHTIKDTNNILRRLEPIIAHHADIVKRIEDIGWLWSRWSSIGLITALLGIFVWAIAHGWVVK
jgi:hypothetical protein